MTRRPWRDARVTEAALSVLSAGGGVAWGLDPGQWPWWASGMMAVLAAVYLVSATERMIRKASYRQLLPGTEPKTLREDARKKRHAR